MNGVRSVLSRRQVLKAWTGATGMAATLALARVAPAPRLARTRADRPNIILIVTDALRADHAGPYGYARDTTPELDRWIAKEGVTFRQATSVAAWTFPGTVAIMTGQLPIRVHANWDNTVLPSSCPTLAEMLRTAGYATAGFTAAPFSRASRGFNRGFDIYDDSLTGLTSRCKRAGGPVEHAGPAVALLVAGDCTPVPFPLLLRHPHLVPAARALRPPVRPRLCRRIDARRLQERRAGCGRDNHPDPRDIEHLLALYDGEIAYWDARLGEMLSALQTAGILDNSVVAVTSDHGDMFGEHNLWTHGNSIYEEVARVPLLMRYSGVTPRGLAVDAVAQNMDVAPTLLEWAGLGHSHMDGVSLAAAAAGQSVTPRDVFGEIDGVTDPANWAYWLAPRDTLHSIRRGEYKYIHHVGHEAADELYRLKPASVYEQENLVAAEPATAAVLRAAVIEKFDQHHVLLPATTR